MSEFELLSLENIASHLASPGRTLILTHKNPDGDCIGSAAALAEMIRAAGGSPCVALSGRLPPRLAFLLPGGDALEVDSPLSDLSEAGEFDTVLSVDVASRSQLGSLDALADRVDFMIDHHETGSPFAPFFVDGAASAAGEIVWRLYRLMRSSSVIPATPAVAMYCYAAVVSDTGSFKFSNSTPSSHRAAAEMLEEMNGAEGIMKPEEISRALFSRKLMNDLVLQMLAIKNLTLHAEGKIGVCLLTAADLKASGLESWDTGAAVEIPRSLDGVMIALTVKQSIDDAAAFRISSRSNCGADVAAVCARFGGGGHTKAAGCTITADSPETALAAAVAAFEEEL